ncbi:MAG: toxin-antitoxin system TumE family protein [Burkholderiales bacterium]
MRARQLFRYRAVQAGVTVEMVIWALSQASAERPHGLKYRLWCGRGRACLVRYDNEAGKGDHRHHGDREEAYRFESLEKLLKDFQDDCTRLAGWRWR